MCVLTHPGNLPTVASINVFSTFASGETIGAFLSPAKSSEGMEVVLYNVPIQRDFVPLTRPYHLRRYLSRCFLRDAASVSPSKRGLLTIRFQLVPRVARVTLSLNCGLNDIVELNPITWLPFLPQLLMQVLIVLWPTSSDYFFNALSTALMICESSGSTFDSTRAIVLPFLSIRNLLKFQAIGLAGASLFSGAVRYRYKG